MYSRHHICWLLVVLLAGFHSASAFSAPARPLRRLSHPSTLSIDILPRRQSPPILGKRSLPIDSPVLHHTDSFRLTLTAFDETFYIHLRPNDHLIHPAARVNYYKTGPDGQSVLTRTEPILRESVKAYWGEVIPAHVSPDRLREDTAGVIPRPSGIYELGWARITVYDQGDADAGRPPVFEGAFSVNGVTHHVQTKANYLRNKHALDPHIELDDAHPDANLVIWRDSDVMSKHEHERILGLDVSSPKAHGHGETCGHDRMDFNTDPLQNEAIRKVPPPPYTPWYDAFGFLHSATNFSKRDDVAGGGMGIDFSGYIGQTAGCPTSQKIVYMGVAADCEYTSKYGSTGNATRAIITNWNTASALYKTTFQVSLGIVELQVHEPECPSTATSDAPWNVACSESVTLNDRLSIFSGWRGQKGNDGAGLWHLMSGCPTGSEVGIAWLATLCQQTSSGSSPSIVSGTAVSTSGRTEWQVIAHEIGHNFGAIHDCADGCSCSNGCETDSVNCCPLSTTTCDANSQYIMSPVAETGEMQFSPCSIGNICSLMSGAAGGHTNTTCLIDPNAMASLTTSKPVITLQMCGNGIVESGEDCDPGLGSNSTCCDASTCKFKKGAVCDPDSSQCCTDSCTFAPSTQVCRPAKDATCDTAEMCTGSSATCPPDVFASNGKSCGSNGLACASGQCTSLSQQCQLVGASMGLSKACPSNDDKSCQVSCQDPNNSNQCVVLQSALIDGSPCGYGGTCISGNCKPGSWQDFFKSWYTHNLQISIPVTVIVGLIVLLILYAIARCIMRSRRSKPARTAQRIPSYPGPPPMNFAPSAMVRQNSSSTPMYGPNVPVSVAAAGGGQQRPGRTSHSSRSSAGSGGPAGPAPARRTSGGSNSVVSGGARQSRQGSGHYAPAFPIEPIRNSRMDWVDDTVYNGPAHGRR
ncbi:Metallo-peptidase family M12B Reprolysin-like-domain-containing protein [Dichomitus squalens]|nr:Metallo-peptidase family M12B Reprolysin-like-domain-containing protein [Dichomitus squalens]